MKYHAVDYNFMTELFRLMVEDIDKVGVPVVPRESSDHKRHKSFSKRAMEASIEKEISS